MILILSIFLQRVKSYSDGKILVAGEFTSFNGISRNYLLRLNSNGTEDDFYSTIGNIFNSVVTSVAIQSDNKIAVSGNFKITLGEYFAPYFALIKAI